MNHFVKGCLLLLSFTMSHSVFSQKKYEYSAKQAVEFAMKNATEVKNALLDIQLQQQSNREITSAALPQINGSINGTHYIDIPTTTLPDFISPSVYGVLVQNGVKDGNGDKINFPSGGFGSVPAKFGTQWNASGGIDMSQILFDGQVFIGLKARSSALKLATLTSEVTKEQIKANVYKLYYQLIVGQQQATTIDANITRFEKLLSDSKEMFKNGFVEKLDVDKVSVQLNNLKTEREKINSQLEMGNAALKFMMNFPQKDTLLLIDSLREDEINTLSLTNSIDFKNRKEYQLLKSALKLNQLNIARYQLSKLPTIIAFGSYSKNAQRNEFNFFDKGEWFSTSLVGVKISVPLFDGFGRAARIQKARLELSKTKNNQEKLEQAIAFEVKNASIKRNNAIEVLSNQKQNVLLAEQVYNTTQLKYQQGLGSNMEIYNAQTELKMAQNNYYGALYDAIIAKIDYLKATGTLQ